MISKAPGVGTRVKPTWLIQYILLLAIALTTMTPVFSSDWVSSSDFHAAIEMAREKLSSSLQETEQMNRLMTGREMRVLELKKDVNGLLMEIGREAKYGSAE